jgi:hypothetical protein
MADNGNSHPEISPPYDIFPRLQYIQRKKEVVFTKLPIDYKNRIRLNKLIKTIHIWGTKPENTP